MVFSKVGFCMKLYCSINICLRLLTAGWYVVTIGNFFCVMQVHGALNPKGQRSVSFAGHRSQVTPVTCDL